MQPLLHAALEGSDVAVYNLPGLPGWSALVHADGALTIRPAPGERLTQPLYRRVPIGTILGAAEQITRDDRVRDLLRAGAPLTPDDRRPGHQRHRRVADAYRAALAAGIAPREVVAGVYGVTASKAAIWITDARTAGFIGDVHGERAALTGGTR